MNHFTQMDIIGSYPILSIIYNTVEVNHLAPLWGAPENMNPGETLKCITGDHMWKYSTLPKIKVGNIHPGKNVGGGHVC